MKRFSFEVDADSINEAYAKLTAYVDGSNCPCKLPPWGEESSAEGSEFCTCIVILIEQESK